jgi:hypothetical protein
LHPLQYLIVLTKWAAAQPDVLPPYSAIDAHRRLDIVEVIYRPLAHDGWSNRSIKADWGSRPIDDVPVRWAASAVEHSHVNVEGR